MSSESSSGGSTTNKNNIDSSSSTTDMSAVESRSLRSSSSSGAIDAATSSRSAKRAAKGEKKAKKTKKVLVDQVVEGGVVENSGTSSSSITASKEKKEKKEKKSTKKAKKDDASTPTKKKKKSSTKNGATSAIIGDATSSLSSSRSAPATSSSPATTRRSQTSNAVGEDADAAAEKERREREAVLVLPDGEWSCSACTLFNPAHATACEACETKKPPAASSTAAAFVSSASSSSATPKAAASPSKADVSEDVKVVESGGGKDKVAVAETKKKKKKGEGESGKKKKSSKKTKDAKEKKSAKGKGKLKSSSSRSADGSDFDDDDYEEDDDYFDDGEGGDDSEVDYISGGDYSDDEVNAGLGWEEAEPEYSQAKEMFKIITRSELSKLQTKFIGSVAAELGVNKWDVALLLQYYKWDVTKLHAHYWDQQKKVLKEVGIKLKKKKKKKLQDKNAEVECLVCADDVKASKVFSLACGHGPYCDGCWQYHLSVVVKNSSAEGILNSTCMWPRCPIKLNKKAFKKLALPEDFQRYEYFLMKSYVDNTKNLSWCPNPSCANLVLCTEDVGRPAELVRCTCGHQYCFACGMESHNPVTCDQLSKWQQRNSDDQESIRLVMATSKPCYHCGIPTTRVDGCNHMTCRKEKGGCGGEWCWMCRGDWKSHGEHTGGYYSCNKYDHSSAKDLDDEASKMKSEADRYLHYFNRYFLHETAGKSVPQLRLKALEKQQQYRELTSGNPDFLIEAVDLLAKCRHILKYTYVYGFYLPDGSRGKDFFEYLQANAEGITERLSDQVNAPISKLDATSFKNIIRVTGKYIDNMVKGIEDGLGVEGLGKEDRQCAPQTIALAPSRKK